MEEQNNSYLTGELNDLKREREILAEESLSGKNAFASEIKDTLGEQIREVLKKQEKAKPEEPEKKKKTVFKNFLDSLSKICR